MKHDWFFQKQRLGHRATLHTKEIFSLGCYLYFWPLKVQKASSLFLHTFVKPLESKMKNRSTSPACPCRKVCFKFPASSSFWRIMKPANSWLTGPIQLFKKSLEGRKSIFSLILSLLNLIGLPKQFCTILVHSNSLLCPGQRATEHPLSASPSLWVCFCLNKYLLN